jgi:hypothetical protein
LKMIIYCIWHDCTFLGTFCLLSHNLCFIISAFLITDFTGKVASCTGMRHLINGDRGLSLTNTVIKKGCSPTGFTTPLLTDYKELLLSAILLFAPSLLLHPFFLSVDLGTASRTTRFLYNYLECRMRGNSLLLTIFSILGLPWLTFAFCINDPVAIALPKNIIPEQTSFGHYHWPLWHCWPALSFFTP